MMGWDEAPVGIETGRFEIAVTDQVIDDYLAMMELDLPCFKTATEPYGTRIAPPDMVPKLAMETMFQDFLNGQIGTNIRAKQMFRFFTPVTVGTRVHGVGRLAEKYERRGRRFVVMEGLFTDGKGRQLVLDRRTQMILGENFAMRK
jgi:hypothetical protein